MSVLTSSFSGSVQFASVARWRLAAIILLLVGFFTHLTPASVPTADITLEPVVTDNLPLISSLTAYVYANDSDAVSTTLGGTNILYDAPLYYPFDTDTSAWWDNLVAEQLQARLPVAMFASRGVKTTNSNDLSGNMNPRQLFRMVDALKRANATNLFKMACFVDCPNLQDIYTYINGLPSSTLCDLSSVDDWNDVFWLRGVKPWFDTVPRQYWFTVNARPVIRWWHIGNSWFTNQNGNLSQMLDLLAGKFETAYGVRPSFVLHDSWPNYDPTSTNQADVIGVDKWFSPPSKSYTYNTFNGFTVGTAVPGFINSSTFDPTSPNYQSTALVIPHNKVNGTGTNGDTLIAGMEAGVAAKSQFTLLEGWNDVREWAGFYRCGNSPRYNFPSQYINIVRRYTDLRTTTLRLEAEGADAYNDTTVGNTGSAWRRFGDLDIRTLPTNGWAVTTTAAGEWIEFKEINFSAGNYRFPIRYSALANRTVRLLIDGVALPDVVLPATGSANIFDTISLGSTTVAHGIHTLRLFFVDGGVDVDWMFVKKFDPVVTFQSALNGNYLAATLGGNDGLVCNWNAAGAWGQFTVDDLASSGTIISSNAVNLQAYNGLYLSATNGGGSSVLAKGRTPASAESFSLIKLGGSGAVTNGNSVVIRTSGGKFVTVKPDGSVDATGTSIGTAQTFTLQMTTNFLPITPVTSAPTGLVASATSSRINLSWKATPGAMSYVLKRAPTGAGTYAIIATGVTATNFSDLSASAGVTYFYVVSALNSGGESSNSAPATAIIPLIVSEGAPVTASSQQSGNEAFKGNDSDSLTRWAASSPSMPQWWKVDLGTNRNLAGVNIDWYNSGSRAYGYQIAVSSDNTNFTTVVDKSGNTSFGNTTDNFSALTKRYVRITVTSTTQVNGNASFYECKVYGVSAPVVALNPTNITAVLSGNLLTLSWPANYLGWRIQVQTNQSGIGTNWVTLPGTDLVTSTNIPINPTNCAVFYRMVYP
jgi:Domain of unknown function (DUF5010)/DUF5010 C-terminal domain/F5/8 type C domain